ncbi:MAG: heparinase II/III family protein [Planctomycetes bacterium]|nr:heparinase II/III family protein [Planctomycetota bacterium]
MTTRAHPYLYFNRDDLPALRRRWSTPPFAERRSRLLRNAQADLKRKPVGFDEPRQALGICGTCAFAYVLKGDRRFGARALREAWALLDAPSWHSDRGWNRGADLGTSEAAQACALVYDWCHDLLDPDGRARYRERLLHLSTRVYLRSLREYKDWWIDNPVSNWSGVCHGGNGLAALALYDEAPEAKVAARAAWRGVRRFLKRVILQDGGGHEGVMYRLYGESFSHILAAAAGRFFGGDRGLYAETARKRAGYWITWLKAPDEHYANFNNMGEGTFSGSGLQTFERGPMAMICALYERHAAGGDTLLRWGADQGGAPFYYRGADPFWFLWRSERPVVKRKPKLPEAVLFRGCGHAVLQSPRLWMAFNGGWISNSSHNNRDLGHFVFVADGVRYLHDPGYGAGETGMHSTVLLMKSDQIRGRRAKYLRFGSARGFHYLACDLSAAYAGVGRRVVRHLVTVGGRYAVLLDDVAIQGPGRCELETRFQAAGALRLKPGAREASVERSGKRLHILNAAPADAVLEADSFDFKKRTFTYLRARGDVRRHVETLVHVLWPAQGRERPPKVHFEVEAKRGLLNVTPARGKADRIVFERRASGWRLVSVNGVSAKRIPDGSQQTVLKFK